MKPRRFRLALLLLPVVAVLTLSTSAVAQDFYTRYVLLTDVHTTPAGGASWFTPTATFAGRVHTNGTLRFQGNPVFDGTVSSAAANAWFYNNGTPKLLPDDHNGTIDVPVFAAGFVRGEAPVPLPANSYVQQNAALGLTPDTTAPTNAMIRAQLGLVSGSTPPPNGTYLVRNVLAVAGGIYVQGDADRILVRPDTAGRQTWEIRQGATVTTLVIDDGLNTTSVIVGTSTSVYVGTPRGILYVHGAVLDLRGPDRVSGQPPPSLLDGRQTLVAATGDIVIQRDLTVENFDSGTALIGIFSSGGSVRIGTTAPNDLRLDAFVMATGPSGVFAVDNYDSGVARGTLHLRGGCVERYYGSFGTFDFSGVMRTGYARDFRHDERGGSPPYYPAIGLPRVGVPLPREKSTGLRLSVPRPHPVRGPVRVSYVLARPGHVRLSLYDTLGRRVAAFVDAERNAGEHEASWSVANRPPPGVYLLVLESGGARVGRRVVLLE